MNNFSRNLLLVKEKLGMAFYLKPRKYAAEYSVKVKNKDSAANQLTLIIPVPGKTESQNLLKEPVFNISPDLISSDPGFNNKFAVWQTTLPPGGEIELKEKFSLAVWPSLKNSRGNAAVLDYKTDDKIAGYAEPNDYVHPDNEKIKSLAEKIRAGEKNAFKILSAINEYLISTLRYGAPIEGLYSDLKALEKTEVDCGGFSALYVSLAIACGIPSRVVSGFWAGYEKNTMHAWAESLLPDGTWLAADSATEQLRREGRTKKFGRLGKIGSDRIILSKGCDLHLPVGGKVITAGILQNPIVIAEKGKNSFECDWSLKTSPIGQ